MNDNSPFPACQADNTPLQKGEIASFCDASRAMETNPQTPARRRARQEAGGRLWLRVGLLVFGLLVVLALWIDLRYLPQRKNPVFVNIADELQQIVLGLNGPRYEDPRGLFSIVPPAGWKTSAGEAAHPYDAVFYGPNGADLRIMVSPVKYNSLDALMTDIRKSQKEFGLTPSLDAIYFAGKPAVQRTCRLYYTTSLTVDFVENHVAHHILFSVPREQFDKYRPVLLEVINTYRTGGRKPREGAPAEGG